MDPQPRPLSGSVSRRQVSTSLMHIGLPTFLSLASLSETTRFHQPLAHEASWLFDGESQLVRSTASLSLPKHLFPAHIRYIPAARAIRRIRYIWAVTPVLGHLSVGFSIGSRGLGFSIYLCALSPFCCISSLSLPLSLLPYTLCTSY